MLQKRGDVVDRIYNESGGVEITGIEFNPINMDDPRDETYRKQIMI